MSFNWSFPNCIVSETFGLIVLAIVLKKSDLDDHSHSNLRYVRSYAPNKAPVDQDVHNKTLKSNIINSLLKYI